MIFSFFPLPPALYRNGRRSNGRRPNRYYSKAPPILDYRPGVNYNDNIDCSLNLPPYDTDRLLLATNLWTTPLTWRCHCCALLKVVFQLTIALILYCSKACIAYIPASKAAEGAYIATPMYIICTRSVSKF